MRGTNTAGRAMHGMLAVFNECQVLVSGEDIKYKIGQKAKNGGTLGVNIHVVGQTKDSRAKAEVCGAGPVRVVVRWPSVGVSCWSRSGSW